MYIGKANEAKKWFRSIVNAVKNGNSKMTVKCDDNIDFTGAPAFGFMLNTENNTLTSIPTEQVLANVCEWFG